MAQSPAKATPGHAPFTEGPPEGHPWPPNRPTSPPWSSHPSAEGGEAAECRIKEALGLLVPETSQVICRVQVILGVGPAPGLSRFNMLGWGGESSWALVFYSQTKENRGSERERSKTSAGASSEPSKALTLTGGSPACGSVDVTLQNLHEDIPGFPTSQATRRRKGNSNFYFVTQDSASPGYKS